MEINEVLEAYLTVNRESINNLVKIAFDELESEQYEEAVTHFDQLYIKDSNDFMSYFLRAYSKSHCGVRGNVVPYSEKLTAAFKFACKKAIASEKDLGICLSILLKMYDEAMEFLADNAVEEVKITKGGYSYKTNPDECSILSAARHEILYFAKSNVNIIKKYDDLKDYVVSYLKEIVDINLEIVGPVIVTYEPSYQEVLDKKIRRKKAIKIIAVIAPILLIASILTCCLSTV